MSPTPEPVLIFDCDGVLVDSERLSHGVMQQMLAERGVMLSIDATVERFIGTSLPVCLTRAGELLGGTLPDDLRDRFAQRTREAFEAGMRAIGFAAMTPRARLAAAGADALATLL